MLGRRGAEIVRRGTTHPPQKPGVGDRTRKLEKTGLENYPGQNSLEVSTCGGLRRCCPLEILPQAHVACELDLLEVSLGKGIGLSRGFLGAHFHRWYKEEKPGLALDREKELGKHPSEARFNR